MVGLLFTLTCIILNSAKTKTQVPEYRKDDDSCSRNYFSNPTINSGLASTLI